jgi:ribonucleotide monophosphatase NagD (HAD superfamily)
VNAASPPLARPQEIFDRYVFGLDGTLYLGDQLLPDLAAVHPVGMPGALVLTGESAPEAVKPRGERGAPDYVLERVDQLFPAPEWNRRGWVQEP